MRQNVRQTVATATSAVLFLVTIAAAPLCYRTGTFLTCSEHQDYESEVICENPNGEPWSCPSNPPTQNDQVIRCRQVLAGEVGKDQCLDNGTVKKCVYVKAKCGENPGECGFEPEVTLTLEDRSLQGVECVGQ